MNASSSSSSLPTGWITFWIALGVIALAVFVALPIAITQKAQSEFLRYQACVQKTQTTDCEPSIAWEMNGWSLEAAATASTTQVTLPLEATTSTTP